MFRRKVTIVFTIIAFATIGGFIIGVAPGYFIKGYALFGVAAGFLLIIFILLIIIALIYEYLNRNPLVSIPSNRVRIFHESLSTKQKVLFSIISALLFLGGAMFGIIWGLLLKAISVSIAAYLISTAIFLIILLVVLVIILLVEFKKFGTAKVVEQQSVIDEPNPRSQVLTKSQDGPKNTASRANRYRSRPFDEDSKLTWQDSRAHSPVIHSTNTFRASKTPATIQAEYQRLLRPSSRFDINDKVYANENDIARIVDADGLGNYRIQYLDNGLTDYKTVTQLRKALPLIE